MDYEVTVDFHDDALKTIRTVKNLTELALYLERVPGMIGFEINGEATITITQRPAKDTNT